MDGVNGITGAYAFASLIPLYLLNEQMGFVDPSLIISVGLADLVFVSSISVRKGKQSALQVMLGQLE